MEVSIFLARFWGIYLAFMGITLVFNKKLVHKMFKLSGDDSFLFLSGFIAFFIGLATVILHNVWTTHWVVLITLLGWASLLKGAIRFIDPQSVIKLARKFEKNKTALQSSLLLMVVLGLYLTFKSYFG